VVLHAHATVTPDNCTKHRPSSAIAVFSRWIEA
jgi:hypothetical protein